MSYITPQLNNLITALKKACGSLNRDFSEIEKLQTSMKGANEFAISAYKRVEKAIEIELAKIKPDFPIIQDAQTLPETNCFLLSIIDGVENFAKGIPYFAICIAMVENNEITTSAIYNPASNELFFAQKGKGAYKEGLRNHERLRVSGQKDEKKAIISVQSGLKDLSKTMTYVGGIRILGSAAMDFAYCASGRLDACILEKVNMAVLCSGLLLVKESGGYVYEAKQADIREQDLGLIFKTKNVLVVNNNINKKLHELLQE